MKKALELSIRRLINEIMAISNFAHPDDGPEMYENIKRLERNAKCVLERIESGSQPVEKKGE